MDLLLFVSTAVLVIASPMTGGLLQGRAMTARGDALEDIARAWKPHLPLAVSVFVSLAMAIWAVLVVPVQLAAPTVVLGWGLQAIVLLTGPDPRAARTFAGALTVLGLVVAATLLGDRLALHAGATLLALALWLGARLQRTVAPDALFLLLPVGAFTGFAGLALTGFLALPMALGFRLIKPYFYPVEARRPAMPAEAVVFGLASAFWLVWLYVTVG